MNSSDGPERRGDDGSAWEGDELERASENVLGAWPSAQLDDPPADPARPGVPRRPGARRAVAAGDRRRGW